MFFKKYLTSGGLSKQPRNGNKEYPDTDQQFMDQK